MAVENKICRALLIPWVEGFSEKYQATVSMSSVAKAKSHSGFKLTATSFITFLYITLVRVQHSLNILSGVIYVTNCYSFAKYVTDLERSHVTTSTSNRSKSAIGGLIFVLIGVAVVSTVGFVLHSLSADPQKKLYATVNGTMSTPQGNLPHAFITEGVYPDLATARAHGSGANNNKDWVQYGPATHLVLPQHAYVTMTLHVYDSGENLNNAYFGKVVGTVNGTMTVDGQEVTGIDPTQVQHTFTLHGLPTSTQDPLFVNVPLQRVATDDQDNFLPTKDAGTNFKGHTVVFSFITGGKGEYVWNCEYPCGDGTYQKFGAVMGQLGYMSGKVTVA